jgi:hypothetical protein
MSSISANSSALREWVSGLEPLLELPADVDPNGVLEELGILGATPVSIDLTSVWDKTGLLEVFHRTLECGDWFGFNWDALEEVLYGSEDRSAPERVLVVTGFTVFHGRAPEDAGVFIDIVRNVAETSGSGLRGCVLIG